MTFRKNAILYYEVEIFSSVMALFSLGLIPILGMWLSFLCALPFVILIFATSKICNEFITINDVGITCERTGIQLWFYDWENITELKKSVRFRSPSIEVIPCYCSGNPDYTNSLDHYFQLGRMAKKALKHYGKTGHGSFT